MQRFHTFRNLLAQLWGQVSVAGEIQNTQSIGKQTTRQGIAIQANFLELTGSTVTRGVVGSGVSWTGAAVGSGVGSAEAEGRDVGLAVTTLDGVNEG